MKSKRKTITPSLRFEILKRDNYTCQYCGRKSPDVELEIDHIVPVARGGENNPENLIVSCRECNIGKRDKTNDDWYCVSNSTMKLFESMIMILGHAKDFDPYCSLKLKEACEKFGVMFMQRALEKSSVFNNEFVLGEKSARRIVDDAIDIADQTCWGRNDINKFVTLCVDGYIGDEFISDNPLKRKILEKQISDYFKKDISANWLLSSLENESYKERKKSYRHLIKFLRFYSKEDRLKDFDRSNPFRKTDSFFRTEL